MKTKKTNKNVACICGKVGDPKFERIVHNVKSMPIDHVKQKVAKNHCLLTCKSWFDFKNKILYIDHMVNANTSKITSFTFKEIADEFGWKSFKISENEQTVYPIFYST